jgi:hypothetical protein
VLAAAFLAAVLFVVLHHEPWRDEVEFWLMARSSASLSELGANVYFANQTRLWPLLLYGISRVSRHVEAMQIFHVLIGAAAAGVWARQAPFSPGMKWLFVFGYYPLFEYGVIARSYGLGMLLTFTACALFARRPRPHVWLGLCLFVLAQTSAFAAMIAVALALATATDEWLAARGSGPRAWPAIGVVMGTTLAGLALSIAQMVPPESGAFTVDWQPALDRSSLTATLGHLWRGYVPLPRFTLHFWNTNVLDGWTGLQVVLGVALWIAAAVAWRSRPAALVLHLSGTGAILLFVHLSRFTSARHIGHLYLLLAATAWTARVARGWRDASPPGTWGRPVRGAAYGLLALHAVAGAYAAAMDVRYPFSGGRAAAEFLRRAGLADAPLVVDPAFVGPPVAVALDRPFYDPGSRTWGWFVTWNEARGVERAEVPIEAQALARERGQPVVLLSNRPVGRRRAPFAHLAEIAGCIVQTEQYQVYLVPAPPS